MVNRLAFTLLAFALWSLAVSAVDDGVEEVERCVRSNLPEQTARQRVTVECKDRTGGIWTQQASLYWRRSEKGRSETLIEIEEPSEDRGVRYLWHWYGDEKRSDTWICLPDEQRVRRIQPGSAEGQLLCTDLTYADLQHIQRITRERGATRLPDASLDGRDVYVVRSELKELEGSAYDRIVYFVDRKTCIPLKIEFFETPGKIHKVLTSDVDSIIRTQNGWVAREVAMKDLSRGRSSRVVVTDIDFDADVPRTLFTLSHLERRCR